MSETTMAFELSPSGDERIAKVDAILAEL